MRLGARVQTRQGAAGRASRRTLTDPTTLPLQVWEWYGIGRYSL